MSSKYQNLPEDLELQGEETPHGKPKITYVRVVNGQAPPDAVLPQTKTKKDTTSPGFVTRREPRVTEEDMDVQTRFIQQSLIILLLAIGFTMGMVYLFLRLTDIAQLVVDHAWLQAVVAISFLFIVFGVVCCDRQIHHADTCTHVVVLCVTTVLMTFVLTVAAAVLGDNRDVLFRSVLFTACMIFLIIFYTIQPFVAFTSCCGYAYVLVIGVGTLVFIYLPYLADLSSGNIPDNISKINWTDPPRTAWSFVISLVLAIFISLYFVFRFQDVMHRCSRKQVVYAAYRVYVDLVSFITMILRMDLSCSSLRLPRAPVHGMHAAAVPAAMEPSRPGATAGSSDVP